MSLGLPHISHVPEILEGYCSLPEGARHCDNRPSDATPPFINAFSKHRPGFFFRMVDRMELRKDNKMKSLFGRHEKLGEMIN